MSGVAPAAEAPGGVHALTPARQPVGSDILAHPAVSTVVLRSDWVDVEPEDGRHDFRYLEEQLDRVARAGKAASLVVTTGGKQVPPWLAPRLGEPFRFTDQVRFHASYGQTVSIPVFWDPVLLAHQRRFMAALGARFAAHPALRLVSVQCANATTDDWNIPGAPEDLAAWRRLGFSTERLLAACRSAMDAAAEAFPRQIMRMAIGRVPAGLAEAPAPSTGSARPDAVAADAVARGLWAHAQQRWPGRFLLQRHNLSARTPRPDDPAAAGWRVVADACPACAAQFLWPVVDTRSCRANGGRQPCEAVAMFRASADTALAYGLRYVEVYSSDLREPSLQGEIDRLARGLAAKTGLLPAAEPVATSRLATPASAPLAAVPVAAAGSAATSAPATQTATAITAAAAAAQGDARSAVPADPAAAIAQTPGVHHLQFFSAAYGRARPYSIWLPPSYGTGTRGYPVLYWLHGKGGDPRRSSHLVQYLERAMSAGRMPETIMVFPDGDNDRFYSDAADGRSPVESMIVRDLIPFIDARYRTIASPRHRMIEGFSMGGFGALKLAARYPDLFASVVAYGAPRLDANLGMGGADAAIFREVFGGDLERFRRETPVWLFTEGAERIRASGLKIRIVAGGEDGTRHSVLRLHEALRRLGIVHQYEAHPGVRHAPGLYYEAEKGAGFDLHLSALGVR